MDAAKRRLEKEISEAMKLDYEVYSIQGDQGYTIDSAKKIHDVTAKEIIERCSKKKFGRAIDCGCGFGDLAFALAPYCSQMYGIEPNKRFVELCKKKIIFSKNKNLNFSVGVCEKIRYPDGYFDLIVTKTVLEHVQDLEKSILEMTRVLRSGGKIYIECPNYMWFWEEHFHAPMLPLMPRWLFKAELFLLGKNVNYLDGINYVTPRVVAKMLKKRGVESRFVSEELIENVLCGKSTVGKSTHPFVFNVIKVFSKIGLGRMLFWIVKVTKLYPYIIIVGTKK